MKARRRARAPEAAESSTRPRPRATDELQGIAALQRSAGNAAVAQALAVQRAPAPKEEELGGLGARFAVDQYVGVAHKLQENWTRLTPYGRAKVLVNASNFELAHIDVPPVELAMGDGAHDDGEFDQSNWTMTMARPPFAKPAVTDDEAAEVAGFVYHEARHAEQYFLIARMLAGKHMTAAEIHGANRTDERIAGLAAKQPLQGPSSERTRARRFYESEDGRHKKEWTQLHQDLNELDDHLTARRLAVDLATTPEDKAKAEAQLAVSQQAYDLAYAQYRALPEEADAWKVGDEVTAAYSKPKPPKP